MRSAFTLCCTMLLSAVAATAAQPNIIIILTDDHGFTDLGIHGVDANVKTPALDKLAANGALMKYGYATAPQCVPSRAGLMTGRIQNTFGTHGNEAAVPIPLDVPTIAERLKALGGYTTGMVGKWHLNPKANGTDKDAAEDRSEYDPGNRGFDEYWSGSINSYHANFNLEGESIEPRRIRDNRNRVIVQGEAGQAFIQRNRDKPFFLYLALFGPHWPRIKKDDPYYQNFPSRDYPQYSDEMDDIRRQGLALVHAIDDAVAGVVSKLRELGLEESTLILFAGDNGSQPKYWKSVGGRPTLEKWIGSDNVPLRGEKGSLWEGGIKVPMLAYWKGKIAPGQVIHEPISTLDFTATALALAGGTIPERFDGADILPRLTGKSDTVSRRQPMFWNWGREVAMRDGDWKIHRIGGRESLLNLVRDPFELYDLKLQEPERFAAMRARMMAWYQALPEAGRSALREEGDDLYVRGAPGNVPPDPRFVIPYTQGQPAAYPAPLVTLPAVPAH